MNTRSTLAAFAAAAVALVAACATSPAAFAQDKMGGNKMGTKSHKMRGGKMAMAGKTVYACKECKMYYSAADARKMGMKDPMGHKLTRMSRASATKMGMKMSRMGNMGAGSMSGDNMSGHKMGGSRP